jgi:hypothetical protein
MRRKNNLRKEDSTSTIQLRLRGGGLLGGSENYNAFPKALHSIGIRPFEMGFLNSFHSLLPSLQFPSTPVAPATNELQNTMVRANTVSSELTVINDAEKEEHGITFYQGFKATHPRLTPIIRKSKHHHKESKRESVVMNIQKIFSDLLNQRDEYLNQQDEVIDNLVS